MKASVFSKAAAVLLCFALVLVFPSCKKEETPEDVYEPSVTGSAPDEIPAGVLTAPFTTLDSLNPFFCDSILNSALIPLLYSTLYTLNSAGEPLYNMVCEDVVTCSSVKAVIPEGLVFSDSSPVTSADIVYSFECAKDSPLYEESLSVFSDCTAQSEYSVLFETEYDNINAVNLLTFPVVKNGTAESEDSIPTGSGPFIFEKDSLRSYLTCNLKYAGSISQIGTVRLYDITDSSSLMHMLDTGSIDCFFTDLSDGNAKRTYSSVNEIYLNNLVFLGVNHSSYRLSSSDVRNAVELAIDKRAIAENAFLSHARVAYTAFSTSWAPVSESAFVNGLTGDSDIIAADAILNEFNLGNDGDTLHVSLICRSSNSFIYSAAALIKEQLSLVNIDVSVKYLSDKDYEKALSEGEFDLYLGEIKLTDDMCLYPFFLTRGEAHYGIDNDYITADNEYEKYLSGQLTLDEYLEIFNASKPFIPLVYRNGEFCYSRRISGTVESSENNLFMSLDKWKI